MIHFQKGISPEHVPFPASARGSAYVRKSCGMELRTLHQWQASSPRRWSIKNGGTCNDKLPRPLLPYALIHEFHRVACSALIFLPPPFPPFHMPTSRVSFFSIFHECKLSLLLFTPYSCINMYRILYQIKKKRNKKEVRILFFLLIDYIYVYIYIISNT